MYLKGIEEYTKVIENHNPFDFPEGIFRVTAGNAGECLMVIGSEKTAIIDCGMAYCGKKLVENIKETLKANGREKLDYVMLTHSHYDHMGALPYVLKAWPDAKVCASAKTKKVFTSTGARETMRVLSEAAKTLYKGDDPEPISMEGIRVDIVLDEGDSVSIGDEKFVTIVTKGHTDCSISFALEPRKILFLSESTGVMMDEGMRVEAIIVKSGKDAYESVDKCIAYDANVLITPHYGVHPHGYEWRFFEMFKADQAEREEFVLKLHKEGKSFEEIFAAYDERFKTELDIQPHEAFVENAKSIIKVIINEHSE